jgi:hypothetical protein
MRHLEEEKQKEITNLKQRGYKRYPKTLKNYPEEEGQMICLFQISDQSPWAQTKIEKKDWEYYKKTSEIRNRSFYWKKN